MKKSVYTLLFVSALILIASCGKDKEEKNLKNAAVSLVDNQEDIIGYGFIDVAAIIEKGDLTSIDPIGRTIENNFTKIANAVKTDEKMFFALSGPLDRNGFPAKVIGLAKVNNKDSVQQVFTEMGYSFEEEKKKYVYYDMSTAIGISDDFIVFVTADFQGDPKAAMLDAFKAMSEKSEDEKIDEILSEEADILIASHLENLYATSNTSLNNLPEAQKKEITEMVENSHISTTVNFNDGDLTIAMNSSRVSEKMKSMYFMKDEGAQDVAQSIGPGKPVAALALAMDVAKMEKFINKFSPGAAKELYRNLGLGGFFLQAMGSEGIASLVSGNAGFSLTKFDEDMLGFGGSIPVFNAYAGLGKNGKEIKDLIHTFSQEEDSRIEDLGDGYYRMEESIVYASNEEVMIHSNDSLKEQFSKTPITKTDEIQDFGEYPLHFYVDMGKFSSEEITGNSQLSAILKLSKYMTIKGNNEGVTLKLMMKNQQENVLKQIVNETAEQFKSQLSAMPI
tara:strand:- start:145012 stop:146529 length:1518 start_codon:yes stop_codon:yes gene_type:complete